MSQSIGSKQLNPTLDHVGSKDTQLAKARGFYYGEYGDATTSKDYDYVYKQSGKSQELHNLVAENPQTE
jgi:hypothetical protein